MTGMTDRSTGSPQGHRRALVIVHDHTSPPGPVADALRANGFEVIEHKVMVGPEPVDLPVHMAEFSPDFPPATDYDLIVVMGSVCAAYDERVQYWVRPEQQLLRDADGAGVPVLGICFGGQLLAAAHGGAVEKSPVTEIGFHDISSVDESLVPSGPWFEWHSDRWISPPQAEPIASNASAQQAFLLRRNLAVQFHPEVTSATVTGWLDNGGRAEAARHGLDPDVLLAQALGTDDRSIRRATALVEGFLGRVGLVEVSSAQD